MFYYVIISQKYKKGIKYSNDNRWGFNYHQYDTALYSFY